MPHISDLNGRRATLKARPELVSDYGELNYIVTLNLCDRWRAKPRYETFHIIRRDKELICYEVMEAIQYKYGLDDVRAAYECALDSFFAEIVAPYERKKALENGNVYAEEHIFPFIMDHSG